MVKTRYCYQKNHIMRKILFLCLLIIPMLVMSSNQSHVDSLKIAFKDTEGIKRINVLGQLSAYYANSDPDLSLTYDSMALDIAKSMGNKMFQSDILNNMGLSFYAKSDYATAIELISQSLEIKEEIADSQSMVQAMNNLGVIYQLIGDYDNAITMLNRSLSIRRSANDTVGIARSLSNISAAIQKAGKPEQALEMLEEARDLYLLLNDTNGLASVYNNMGTVYQLLEDFDLAHAYFLRSLELKDEAQDARFIANTYNNLGMTSAALDRPQDAIQYYNRALDIRTRTGDQFGLATVNTNMGELHRKLGSYSIAEEHLLTALSIARKNRFNQVLQRCLEELSRLYADQGIYQAAYKYSNEALSYQDTLYSEELNKRVAELEMQRKTEITYRENQMLRLDNQLKELEIQRSRNILIGSIIFTLFFVFLVVLIYIRLKEKRRLNRRLQHTIDLLQESEQDLKEANDAKDKVFSIIAHDLISPFNSMLGFSDLLLKSYNDYDDDEKKAFLASIYQSASDTYKLLKNLLYWGRINTGKIKHNPINSDLSASVNDCLMFYSEQAREKEITTHTNIPDSTVVYADPDMLFMIIRNLISNALKYTQKGGGIHVSAKSGPSGVELIVQDTGIGIPGAWQDDLFQVNKEHKREGTEKETGPGLGLSLVQGLVSKNKGKIWVKSQEGQGSSFHVQLPGKTEERNSTDQVHSTT